MVLSRSLFALHALEADMFYFCSLVLFLSSPSPNNHHDHSAGDDDDDDNHIVALLDSTVKIFHDDSLKFFLSLYGHKLPVMSMDISDDGALLATGSADKTVKIWGLDFGDCHRSLLAHDDSIMVICLPLCTCAVFFVPSFLPPSLLF